jgi:Ger(x)C family germination protein
MTLRRWGRAVVAGLLLLGASGCTSMPDIQSNAYATAIGIDYKNGMWIAYAQVINFSTIAHSDQVEIGKEQPVWIGSGKGETVATALTDIGATSQLRMFWGHVKALVMSEAALKKDVKEIYSAINRYREVRYTVYVYGTNRDLREVLMQKSLLNMSPLYTTMFTGTQSSAPPAFIQPITANRAISDLNEPGEHAWIPSIGIDTGDWTEDAKPRQMFMLTGAYFFRGNQMATWMSVDELRGGRWAEPELERTPVIIRKDRSPVAMLMLSKPKLAIKIVDEPGGPRFKLYVKTKGFVMELMKEASIAEMEAMAARTIASEVEETFRKAVRKRCDPFGLLEELYRSKPGKFHEVTTGSGFALSERSLRGVEVKVRLVNTGKYQGKPP